MSISEKEKQVIESRKAAGLWIGDMSYVQPEGKGEFPGALVMEFSSIKAFNRFFKPGNGGDGALVIDVQFFPSFWGTKVIAVITNQLSPAEIDDLMEVQREVEFAMAKRRQERKELKEKEVTEKEEANKEKDRLATVGKKYEERVRHVRSLSPSDLERKKLDSALNAGDPEILFQSKEEAFKAGFVHGHQRGQEGDK